MRAGRIGLGALVCLVGAACGPTERGEETSEAASAILAGSTFEGNDGNRTVTTPGGTDWDSPPPNLSSKNDLPSGPTDDSFGGGAKENSPVPNVVTGSIPGNKSDLTHFDVAFETVGASSFLYLAWDRANSLGTANIDFEFNQSTILSANLTTPIRTPGDLLIQYDFGGSGTPVISFRIWGGSSWGSATALAAGVAEAGIRTPDFKFGEAAINLNAAGLIDPKSCTSFGRAYVKSRASTSFTAELKDFIAPTPINLHLCRDIRLEVHKVDDSTPPVSLAGAVFQLFKDTNNNGTLDTTDQRVPDASTVFTTDVNGIAFFNVQTPPPATVKDTYFWHEVTAPIGFEIDPTQNDQAVEVKSDETNTLLQITVKNKKSKGKVLITKTDDAGNPVNGIPFTIVGPGGTLTCTTGTSAPGQCEILDVPVGTYTVDEDVSVAAAANYSKDLQFTPNLPTIVILSNLTTPFTATNPRRHRVMTIVCHEGTNTLVSTPDAQVTLNSQTKPSITSVPAHLAAKGVTEADLCTINGAFFDHLPAGTFPGQVVIP